MHSNVEKNAGIYTIKYACKGIFVILKFKDIVGNA